MSPPDKDDPAQLARDRLDYYAAIERELTRDAMRWLRAYAKDRCELLAKYGKTRDPDELLGDAIADTLEERRPWVRGTISLRGHLRRQIQSRTNDLMDHAVRFPHQQLDHRPGMADRGTVQLSTEPDSAPAASLERRSAASSFLEALYQSAREQNDRVVVGMLDAYREGITRRSHVAEHLGIRVKQYDHARDRLSRMVKKLPAEVTADAREVMRQWS